jgi:RNA polymerase sigma-70 factor (ECF subfamily)
MFKKNLSDKELLQLFRLGGSQAEKAFACLVDQFSEVLYWQIRRLTRNHELTNDILQNVWIKVWRNIDGFNEESTLFTWIYRICRNETINGIKKEGRHQSMELDHALISIIPGHSTLEKYSAEQITELLFKAIEELPEKQSMVFQLKYFDELKYSEISRLTGTSEGALKASYSIAVEKIQQFLTAN